MLEVDDPADLPPYTYLVRRRGRAVAAYSSEERARLHAAPLEDATVWCDRGTGLVRQAPWRIARDQRARDGQAVERLVAWWLAG